MFIKFIICDFFMRNSCIANGVAVQLSKRRYANVTFKQLIIEARLFGRTMYVSLRIQLKKNYVMDSTDRSSSEKLYFVLSTYLYKGSERILRIMKCILPSCLLQWRSISCLSFVFDPVDKKLLDNNITQTVLGLESRWCTLFLNDTISIGFWKARLGYKSTYLKFERLLFLN